MLFKKQNLFLALLSGLLLWAAWPTSSFTFLIFIAFVPLLFIAEKSNNWKQFFALTYLSLLIWNVLTTWWVAKASFAGGLSAFFANSLVMCVPWLSYFAARKFLQPFLAAICLISCWISFEYIHHNWDLSWPWLTLGNVFGNRTNWVQWYENTGTTGGSLWVLISNLLVYHLVKKYRNEGRSNRYFILAAAWIVTLCLPILISFRIKPSLTLLHNKYNVVMVQPNFDPWDEKFDPRKQANQLQTMITLAEREMDGNTALVLWPETAIPFGLQESDLRTDERIAPVWDFLKRHPSVNLLTGIEGYQKFDHKISKNARAIEGSSEFYEAYNSVGLFDSSSVQIHHKSKLVPGPEILPGFLYFMAPLFEKFGGTVEGYAKDTAFHPLRMNNHIFSITPAICYESIYGDFLADYNRQDANLICVITNDGWWGNTQGYQQHLQYDRLRAIESRKWIARNANTGISCFIDPFGNIIQPLGWDRQSAIKQDIAAYVTETFFTKHGDYLSKFFSVLSIIAIVAIIFIAITKMKNKHA